MDYGWLAIRPGKGYNGVGEVNEMERTDVYFNQDYAPVPQPPEEESMQRLTFQDGFYFGCGFFVAGIIAYLLMVIVLFLAFLVFSVAFGTSLFTLFQ